MKTGEDGFLLLAGEASSRTTFLDLAIEEMARMIPCSIDGSDDFLAPHGGTLDAGLVDPTVHRPVSRETRS